MKKLLTVTLFLGIASHLFLPMHAQEKGDIYVRPTNQESRLKTAGKIALTVFGTCIGLGILIIGTRRIYLCCSKPKKRHHSLRRHRRDGHNHRPGSRPHDRPSTVPPFQPLEFQHAS